MTWKKFGIQKNNFINKFYFCPNFFSYCFLSNFIKLCNFNLIWLKLIFIWFKDILFELNKFYFIWTNHFFKSRKVVLTNHFLWFSQNFFSVFSFTKIRPQAIIDNFAFKNSNIIIEGLFWKRKDDLTWKKFEKQKNNFINKFYFWPKFFSYRFLWNFKKLCDSNKSWIIFSEKRFPKTSRFLIF